MPRVRRRPRARIIPLDCVRTRIHLVNGCDWPFLDGDELTEDELREVWTVLKAELMAEWFTGEPIPNTLDERGELGCRPWAWWAFDALEPRRVLVGQENSKSGYSPWRFFRPDTPAETIRREWPAKFAKLSAAHAAGQSQREYYFGIPNPRCDAAQYESETDYLTRLGLLTDLERRLAANGEL